MEKKLLFTITKSFCNKYRINEDLKGLDIVIYSDRFLHIEKHKNEYSDIGMYKYTIDNLHEIIKNPDFITVNNKNRSMNFIKKLEDNILVAITIDGKRELKVKTVFPISNVKYRVLKEKSLWQ